MPTEAEVRAALDRLRVRQRDWEEETGNTPEEMELATAREDARLRGQRNVADMTRSPTSAMDLLNPSRALAAMRVGADKLDFSPGEFSASDLLTGGPRGFLEGLSNIPEGIGQGVETAARTAMAVPQFGLEGLGALGVEGAEDAAGFIRRGREQSSTETAESMDAITGRTGTIGGSVGAQTGKVATEFALTGAPLLRAFRGAGKVGQLVARALSATPIAGGEADITTLREGLEGWDRAKFILMEMGIEAGTAALFPGGKEAVFGGNRAAGALRRSLPEVPQELLADFGSTLNAYAQLPSQQNKAPLEVLHEFAQRIPETALTAFFASEAIQAGPVASRAMAERSQDRAFTQRVDEVAPQQALQIMQQTVAEQYRAEGLQAPENLVAQEGTGQETQPGPVREATFRRRRMEGREQVDPMTELKVSTETPAPRTIAKQHRQETQALFEEVGRRREAGENLRRLEVREQKVRQAAQERGEARAVREGVASVREDLNAIREDIDPEIAADIDEELNRPDLTLDEVVELGDLIEVAIDETAPATAPEAAPEAGAVAPEAAPVAPAPVEAPARPRAAAPVETAPEAVPAPVAVDTAPEPVAAPEPEPVPAAEPAAEVAESAPEPRGTRPQSAAAMRGVEAAEAARADLPDTWEEQARPMGGFTERRPKYRAPLGTSFQDWQSRLPAKDQERLSKAQTRVRAAKTAPAIARRQGEVDALRKELGWTEAHRRADRPRDNIARQETRRATGEVAADVPVQPRRSTKPTREAASEVGRVARTKNRLREAPPRVRGEILADTAPRHMQELRRAAKADPELASLMSSAVEVDIMAGEGEATEVAFMRPEAPETRTAPDYTTEQVNRLTEQTPTLQTPEDARAGMESATEVGLQPTPEQQQAVASDILSPDMRDRIADEGSRVDAAFELAAQMGTDFPTTMVMLGRVADGELTTPDQIVEELDRQTRLYSGLPGDALAPLGNAIVTMVGAGYDKTFGLWSRSLIDQVRRLPNGGPVADNARAHYDLVREHMGEAEKLRQQIMETMGASEGVFQQFAGMAGFGKSAEGARVRQELMSSTPVENADGQVVATTSVFRRAVEGKLTTAEEASLSEDARKVIGLYRELNRITGQWMTDAGAEIRLSSGEWVPFKPDADGKRLMRRATRDGIRVMRDPTSAEGQAFLDAVLVMNPDLTREQLTDAIGASADAATRLSAMERARVVENVPDTIIANGKSIPIFEPDPMAAAESQIRSSAMRSSYIQTFGQPRANSMTAVLENETIARFVLGMSLADAYTAGILNPDTTYTRDNIPVRLRESFIAAENLVNTLNGIPPNQDIPVYSPMVNTAADAWNLTMSAVKTLALSRSAVVNFPETLGNVYSYAGPVAWGSAVYSYVADVLGVQTTVDNLDATDRVDLIEEIERIGAVQQHLIHATLEPGRAMQSLGRLTRDVGMRLVLAQPINTANEYIAAVSGLLLAKDIRKHNGSWNPFMRARVETRLQMLEYTPSEIDSILGSDAPTAIMETIPGRMAEASIGTTSMGAERSRAANTRWYNHLIAFDSFAQMKWNRSMRAAKLAAGDIRTALFDPTHRNRKEALTKALASSLFAAENIGGTTAAAGFALSMRSMLLYGAMGLAIEDDEFWRNPVNYLRELFLIAFLGGPASAIVTATEDAEDLEDLVLSTLTRVSLPIGLSLDFLQMLRSEGRYANLDAADRTATFLKSRTPAAGTLQLVAFTVGMADDDPALRGAARTYWEWRRENDETPPRQRGGGAGSTLTQEEHSAQQRQFRIHSKKVIAALRSGKRPEQVVKHIEDALGIAIKVSDNGTIQEGLSRVVQSLAQRKYWNPATSDERGVWSEESIKRARSEMDPKAVAKLDAHDRAVDELISALRRTEGKEYRPARQRELQGEPSSEEDIYAALGRIRDQVPSTAEGFADEGSQFSLLRGYNPDQMAKTHGLSPEDGVRLRLMQRRAMTGVNNMLKTIALMNDRGQFKAAEKVRDQIETNATRMLNRMQQFVERRSAQSP